ncbi:LysE family translocator [Pseudoduganella aquatica]|uniref:LysE family transporter n=1 Tax=Pseudoduganella aquatica TaxID=2660641 RepID=A0A7X4KLB2_9BURK|nr:LysE family transporter [Pseudoduganella aquatica]MYN06898.1 LysE family transporter [Pseudoduganella aquatica]
MMEFASTLARGAVIGFAIAAPVGPVGLLCIRRTFAHGPRTGMASGLGAATADAMYGLVAALGVSAVAALLLEHAATLRIVGGLLMAVLGVAALRRARGPAQPVATGVPHAASSARTATSRGLLGAFGTTFALTASSPMTILSFAGLLAALAPPDGSMQGGLILVAGVFAGSIAWWTMLVGGVAASRRAVSARMLRTIEAVSGIALLAFAAWSICTGVVMA